MQFDYNNLVVMPSVACLNLWPFPVHGFNFSLYNSYDFTQCNTKLNCCHLQLGFQFAYYTNIMKSVSVLVSKGYSQPLTTWLQYLIHKRSRAVQLLSTNYLKTLSMQHSQTYFYAQLIQTCINKCGLIDESKNK